MVTYDSPADALRIFFASHKTLCRHLGQRCPAAMAPDTSGSVYLWMQYRPSTKQPSKISVADVGSEVNSTSIPAAAAATATFRE